MVQNIADSSFINFYFINWVCIYFNSYPIYFLLFCAKMVELGYDVCWHQQKYFKCQGSYHWNVCNKKLGLVLLIWDFFSFLKWIFRVDCLLIKHFENFIFLNGNTWYWCNIWFKSFQVTQEKTLFAYFLLNFHSILSKNALRPNKKFRKIEMQTTIKILNEQPEKKKNCW